MAAYRSLERVTADEVRDHHCPRCDTWWPVRDLVTIALGSETALLCPTCRGFAVHYPSVVRKPLWPMVLGSTRYIATTEGWIAIVALALGMALIPRGSIVLAVGYLMAVVRASARGEDSLPQSLDFTSLWDILRPVLRLSLACVIAALPYLCVTAIQGPGLVWGLLRGLAVIVGFGYLPAAIAHASHCEATLTALNPFPPLALITRIPREYGLLTLGLGAMATVAWFVPPVCRLLLGPWTLLPVVPAVLVNTASLVVPMLMARVMGIVLRERATELGLEASRAP